MWYVHGQVQIFYFSSVSDMQSHPSVRHYCYQLPGDVLFVPEGWGHAVINKQHSVAVAMEFT